MSPSQPAYYIEDRRISSHPQMSASHLLGLQGPQQTPALVDLNASSIVGNLINSSINHFSSACPKILKYEWSLFQNRDIFFDHLFIFEQVVSF